MRIREAIIKYVNELPGYDLVGYEEVAVPIFQKKLQVLTLTQNTIPVVEEFVLNFFNEKLNLDEIKAVLSIEQELIDEAWAGLIKRDYVNHFNSTITESGLEYLERKSVENLERIELSVSIDAITGEISKVNNHLMTTSVTKDKGIRSLRANIGKLEITSLDFKEVRRIFNQYKEISPDTYVGNMLDIVYMDRGNKTRYKRIDILLYKNENDDVRILAYDRFNLLDNYEEKLLEMDNKGIKLLKHKFSQYFDGDKIIEIEELIQEENNKDCEVIEYEKVNEVWNRNLDKRAEEIIIVAPLVSKCKLTGSFIDEIERKLKDGMKISFIVSGKDYISEYQKKNYINLSKLNKSYKNFTLLQVPFYLNKMIINNKKNEALISVFEKKDTGLTISKVGVIEKFYEVKGETFDKVKNIVTSIYNIDCITEFDLSNCNKNNLKTKMLYISKLVKDLDGYMYNNDEIGWIGDGEIPNINKLIDVPLAKNIDLFTNFITNVNKALVESLDSNAKNKGKKKYFWNDFKNDYPNLQHILDKIRTYRNRANHLDLTEQNKKKYFDFLQEDLKGYMPDFIENAYLVLQWKIINQLEDSIKKHINEFKY